MSVKAIQARSILNWSMQDIWGLDDGSNPHFALEFDDGVVQTRAREIIFSWYHWQFHRLWPKTPLLIHHHIHGYLNADTSLVMLGHGLFDCFALQPDLDIDDLSKIVYEVMNVIYNDLTIHLEEYVNTISVLDFIQVLKHPVIEKANEDVVGTMRSVEKTYHVIQSELRSSEELKYNALSKAVRGNFVSIGQVLQCVGPRGPVTEIDSKVFPHPILRSYAAGFRSMHDLMIESRSASKALMFTKDPLAAAEYFNRKLQFVINTFSSLWMGDCGTTEYMVWQLKAGELSTFVGKFYLDEASNQLKVIRSTDKHLIGKRLRIRSVFHCLSHAKGTVCSTCFGEIAYSIPKHTTLGHVCSTVMCEEGSQKVLSTKHHDAVTSIDGIEISEADQVYIQPGEDSNYIHLAERWKGKAVKMIVSNDEAANLSEVNMGDDVRMMSVTRLTGFSEILLVVPVKEGTMDIQLTVSVGSRYSSFTHDFLEYVRERGWSINDDGNYEFELKDWDTIHPIFELPMKHLNMVEYLGSIESTIKTTNKIRRIRGGAKGQQARGSRGIASHKLPEDALRELYELVSTKLSVNVAHLEVIIKAMMVTGGDGVDLSIPTAHEDGHMGYYKNIMEGRSLAPMMAFEGHTRVLLKPRTYTMRNRADHPLDSLLVYHQS